MAKYFVQHDDIEQVFRNMRKASSREQYYGKRYNYFVSRSEKRRLATKEERRRLRLRNKRMKINRVLLKLP
ncbi:MAG: hypothetical protein OEY79_04820 [Anaplasmataceae bacterium]|nr:hypothetical protein [Anaplasmataceae bacterium]